MLWSEVVLQFFSTCTRYHFRYNLVQHVLSRKAAAGIIKPETLPPTDGAATQHSLRAYLQTRDWILLQSMSLDPTNYGWAIGVMVLSEY